MNYLAHAYLSPEDPEILMGNLWGDLIRPRDYPVLSKGLLDGILLHKSIDAFTDQHNGVDEIMKLLRPHQGKYTPVVADVIMDFILSKYWHELHNEPLEEFCENIYVVVKTHLHLIPERLHTRINRMLEHRWLESCKNKVRMQQALLMLSKRASFENTIAESMMVYELHGDTMDQIFRSFFEELRIRYPSK